MEQAIKKPIVTCVTAVVDDNGALTQVSSVDKIPMQWPDAAPTLAAQEQTRCIRHHSL